MSVTPVGTVTFASGTGTLTPTLPTGHAAGDLLLLISMDRNSASTSTTDPVGYTLLGTDSSLSAEIWGKIDSGAESNPSITWSGTTTKVAQVLCLRSSTGWPTIASALHSASNMTVTNGGSLRVPALTVSVNGAYIVCFSGKATTSLGVTSVNLPADFDAELDIRINNNATNGYVTALWGKQQTTATSIALGTTTVNTNTDSTARRAVAIALLPNAGTVAQPSGNVAATAVGTVQALTYISVKSVYGYDVKLDSANNSYIVGYTNANNVADSQAFIAKYDTNSVLQWQKNLGATGYDSANALVLDSSSNIYLTGISNSTMLLAKYNSSGTLQWQRTLSPAAGSNYIYGNGIARDSANNVYAVGETNIGSAGVIAKYNSSGVIQWQKTLSDGTSTVVAIDAVADSSDNIYITGYITPSSGTTDVLVAKLNSSGVIQWQRRLSSSNVDAGRSIALDASANVYVTGETGDHVLVAKYNSSGTLQWQRTFSSSSTEQGYGVTIDSVGNVCLVGSTTSTSVGSGGALIVKLPADGSKTGTYSGFTYASSSLTDATPSLTVSTATFTDAAGALVDSSGSFVDTTPTLSSTTVAL